MSCTLDLDRGPTLDELLRGCVDAFDAQGKVRDPHLVRLFLMMHPWYLPPAELAGKLLHRAPRPIGAPLTPRPPRYWVRAFRRELAGDRELVGRIRELREALGGPGGAPGPDIDLESLYGRGHTRVRESVRGHACVKGHACARGECVSGDTRVCTRRVSPGPPAPPARRKSCLLLERLEAPELAQHLTHLEHRALARVRLQDFRSFARRGGPGGSRPLQRLVALSNAVSRWVQLLVLSPPAAPQRAQALARCLHVAQSLLELRNFNTLMAVVGGLGHGSITRLRRTLALLPPDVTQLWGRLSAVLASEGNYRRYRALLGGAGGAAGGPGGFRLPALGVHLRDLVALEEALPDWGGPARPHPAKLQQRFAILGGLLGGGEPPVPANPDLLHLLTVSLDLAQTEEQLYQLSLLREPRGGPSSQSAPPPAPPPVSPMDGWVLPAPPRPDPALLRGHLERLVESIFRNYDVDGDGRISREEFGIVRQNFPQLRLFGDLDTDRDGSLTRGEVLAYFLRSLPPPGPPHRFEGSRALRPAACAHCGRLVRHTGTRVTARVTHTDTRVTRVTHGHVGHTRVTHGHAGHTRVTHGHVGHMRVTHTDADTQILGLHKQELKCCTCGLRCHSRCRDQLRVECRRRTQSVADAPRGPPRAPPRGPPRAPSASPCPGPAAAPCAPQSPPRRCRSCRTGSSTSTCRRVRGGRHHPPFSHRPPLTPGTPRGTRAPAGGGWGGSVCTVGINRAHRTPGPRCRPPPGPPMRL
ncbi:RAS guanyl-releasing protein 2-like [Athene noctua]|uniref:RAS guanyl-releasing protein 2-like n=1 Tax=Athene noctua TaxID=126797 RepID=UPI003EBC6252